MSKDEAYDSLDIYMSWHKSFGMSMKRQEGESLFDGPDAISMSTLFLNFQLCYEAVCIGIDYPMHNLEITGTKHPNMSVSLKGLGEPIRALRDLIESVPELVVSFCTIKKKIEAKNQELDREMVVNKAVADIVRRGMAAQKAADKNQKRALLVEFLRFEQENLDCEPLDVIIGETELESDKKQKRVSKVSS